MSIKLMSKVWEITLPPTPKLVLMALADCANDEGFRVFPSIETIADKTCISTRQAQRIMQDLVRDGFIRIIAHEQGGRGRAREYAINLAALEKGDMKKGDILSSGEERVTSDAQKGDICDSKRVTSTSPQPSSNNHQINHQVPPYSPPIEKKSGLPEWMPFEAWEGWLAMRRFCGWKLTDRAVELAIAKLEEYRSTGDDPADVLDQSTLNNWRGLWPVGKSGGRALPADPMRRRREIEAVLARANSQPEPSLTGGCP